MSKKSAKLKYNKYLVDYVSENIDWTPTKKYTEKICEFILSKNLLEQNANEIIIYYIETIKSGFKLFDRYSDNFEKKDITQYNNIDELFGVVVNYTNNFTSVKIRNMSKVDGKLSPGEHLGNYNGYNIYKITNFNEASVYSGHCSWCITKDKFTFGDYTKNDKQFYFALKEGYEKVKKITSENPPYDDFGLSMLAIRVNKDGSFEVTTRYNMDYGPKNKYTNSFSELSKLFNYDDISKIITSKITTESVTDFNKLIDITNLRLNLDINYENIFNVYNKPVNGFSIVGLLNKENYINIETNKLVSQEWFDAVFDFKIVNEKPYALVFRNKKVNVIDDNGNIVSKTWYDDMICCDNYFIIRVGNLYNTMNCNGEILNETWFTSYYINKNFNTIFTLVFINKKSEYLDKNGKLIIKK